VAESHSRDVVITVKKKSDQLVVVCGAVAADSEVLAN